MYKKQPNVLLGYSAVYFAFMFFKFITYATKWKRRLHGRSYSGNIARWHTLTAFLPRPKCRSLALKSFYIPRFG